VADPLEPIFGIDIETCLANGGAVRTIACKRGSGRDSGTLFENLQKISYSDGKTV